MSAHPCSSWKLALDAYRYGVDLRRFSRASEYPGWFDLNIDPGDPLQTMGFETRFREQARHHLRAWGEVVFWKLYGMPPARNSTTERVLASGVTPMTLWSSCMDYMTNPNLESFKAFRNKLFGDGVATAATFPAFIRPDQFPMVDTQITRWARKNSRVHRYSAVGGPDLECVPELQPGTVLTESDWRFIDSWIAWCRFTAWKLSQRTGREWRARDVEMAVFSAQRSHGPELESLI